MNDLFVRIISGLIMIAIALAAAFEGREFFALLVAAAATAMMWDWRQLTTGGG